MEFDSARLQASVRQNSQELASALRDLHAWEKDIKHKEKELKSGKLTLTKASSSSSSSSSSPSSTPPPIRSALPPLTLRDPTADDTARFAELKARGNALFSEGKYTEAIECYNACAVLQPRDALPLSNRAQCLLKLRRFKAAATDCDAALALDPAHVKSLFRRATARRELKQTQAALEDIHRVLKLDEANKPAQSVAASHAQRRAFALRTRAAHLFGYVTSARRLMLKELQAAAVQPESKEAIDATATAAGPTAAAKGREAEAPRRKLIIEEEDDEEDSDEEPVSLSRESAPHQSQGAGETAKTSQLTRTAPIDGAAAAGDGDRGRAMDVCSPTAASAAVTRPLAPSAPASSTSSIAVPAPVVSSSPALSAPPTRSVPSSAVPSSAASSSSSSSGVRVPRSAMDFDSQYRGVRSDPVRLSALLQLIPAAEFPTILRTALDAALFANVMRAIDGHLIPAEDAAGLWHVLSALPTVPRFSLTVGFLGAKDRAVLVRAFRLLLDKAPAGVDYSAVRATASSYRITEI